MLYTIFRVAEPLLSRITWAFLKLLVNASTVQKLVSSAFYGKQQVDVYLQLLSR